MKSFSYTTLRDTFSGLMEGLVIDKPSSQIACNQSLQPFILNP